MYLLHKTISLVWTRYIGSIYHALKNKTPRLAGLGGFGRAIKNSKEKTIETFCGVSFQMVTQDVSLSTHLLSLSPPLITN